MKGFSQMMAIGGLLGAAILYVNAPKIAETWNSTGMQGLIAQLSSPTTLPLWTLIIIAILVAKWF